MKTRKLKFIAHVAIILFFTVLTQVGGVIWFVNFSVYRSLRLKASKIIRVFSFIVAYLLIVLFIVPPIAKLFGRVALPITKSGMLIPHNYITPLLNRHYVKPKLLAELLDISNSIGIANPKLKVSYLDANFPFIDGFPLLPHLSHNDGRKIDLTFYYTKNDEEGNLKPSNLGYGMFVEPTEKEINQTKICKSNGYWQYDYAKYITLGSRADLVFDLLNTRNLVKEIVVRKRTQKVLIEPHIENRLKLNSDKIRFHGCHAVRHDDHIHYQIK